MADKTAEQGRTFSMSSGFLLTDEELEVEFKKLDANNDGSISLEEFRVAFQLLLNQSLTFQELRDLITVFDENKDGQIQFSEFKTMINHFAKNPMTGVVLRSLFDRIDTNHDEMIDKQEFATFMKDASDGITEDIINEMFRIA